MISLRKVHKSFGSIHAVRGVSLEVDSGQVVGVLGPNGAGKTTTIRMICAAIPPTRGTVEVDGLDAVEHSLGVRERIGYLPEATPLYREMRVRDFLAYRAGLYGLTGRRRTRAVERAADQCRLASVLRQRCDTLSKGYRQRVGLASALLHEPKVLILDEPTSGLDPTQIAETRRLIRDLAGERTMLIVSHILPEVERCCDRIVLFLGGRIAAEGTPDSLVRSTLFAGRYIVEARPDAASAGDPGGVFRAVPGVESVHAEAIDGGWTRIHVSTDEDAGDRREALALAARSAGLVVRELRPQAATLEQVYLRLLAEAGGAPREGKGDDSRP